MSRYIRSTTPGASYFFTVTLQDRSADTLVRHVDALRECIRAVKTRHPFDIDAMVVLPEHLHAVWTMPPEDADFPTRWMLVKQGFSKRLGRPVWQRRYWEHQVRDEDDLRRHIDYIHFNPVKHGRVQQPGTGRIRVFIGMCARGGCRRTGGWRETSLAASANDGRVRRLRRAYPPLRELTSYLVG